MVAQDSLNNFLAVAEELAVKGLTTDTRPTGSDTPTKKAVATKRKTSLPPGPSSTPQAAKKPKPSSSQASAPGEDIVDMVEPHLEDVDIKSIKAEPEPSGSGSGAGGGAMVEADLGDESYGAGGADGDDNGDFGAEGEFEGFDQYGDGNEFDDSMGAAGGSGAAADGKAEFYHEEQQQYSKVEDDHEVYEVEAVEAPSAVAKPNLQFVPGTGQVRCITCNTMFKNKTTAVQHHKLSHQPQEW